MTTPTSVEVNATRDEIREMLLANWEQVEWKPRRKRAPTNTGKRQKAARSDKTNSAKFVRPESPPKEFTFIDLFAGIGGFRIAFESVGGDCIFASEWDKFAKITYEANFGHEPAGDITKIRSEDIPDHDVLTAGFPCQPFSIAGVTKHNALGNEHGFRHSTQGTLFFEVARIIQDRQPKAFVLENVKNLISHDKGKTYATILETLRTELKYEVRPFLIDAQKRLPQHRERIYLIGFRSDINTKVFKSPTFKGRRKSLRHVLDPIADPKYTLTDHLWQYLRNYAAKHREKGNGFGFSLVDLDGVTRTLSARYYKDGSEILIPQKNRNPRRLTPSECARLMGFPPWFEIPVSDTQAYRQFGNSVAVPIVTEIAQRVRNCICSESNVETVVKSAIG